MAAEQHCVSRSTMPAAVQLQQQRRGSSSHTTTRPKIKIIHIVAPEIIKTDVANFRDLVQRLTGKQPTSASTGSAAGSSNTSPPPLVQEEEYKETTVKKRSLPPPAAPVTATAERSDDSLVQAQQQEPRSKKRKTIKCEVKVEEGGFEFGDYDLGCNDLWMGLNPGGSFLSFLEEELDVFHGLMAADHDFLQPPLAPARMDLIGEMYAS